MIIYLATDDDSLWNYWISYTPLIQRDATGGFLDMTGCGNWDHLLEKMPRYAQGSNQFVAKVACLWSQVKLVPPGKEGNFLAPLSVETLWPLSGKTKKQLKELGLFTLGQIAKTPPRELQIHFGNLGEKLLNLAQGRDSTPVRANYPHQELSCQRNWDHPPWDEQELAHRLQSLARGITQQLEETNMAAYGLQLHSGLKYLIKISPAQRQLDDVITYRLLPRIKKPTASMKLIAFDLVPYQVEQLQLFNYAQKKATPILKQLQSQFGQDLICLGREFKQSRRQRVLQYFQNQLFTP